MLGISLDNYDYIVVFSAFLVVIIVGLWKSRKITEKQFLVGGRSIQWWLLGPTIAAGVIGGGVLMTLSEYAYDYGYSAFWIIGGLVLGILLLIPFALRFKDLADKHEFYSLPDLFRQIWGEAAGVLSSLIIILWTIGFIVMQLIAGGKLLHAMTGISYEISILMTSGIVLSYLIIGGFRSVIVTDFLQYFALLFLLGFILPSSSLSTAFTEALKLPVIKLDIGTSIAFFVLGALNIIVSADIWQRIYAAKTLKHARKGMVFAAFLILIGGICLMFPAIAAKTIDIGMHEKQTALVLALAQHVPQYLLGFGLAAILMSIMSTLDTMVFVFGLSLSHDLFVKALGMPVRFRQKSVRYTMAIALIGGTLLSILYDELLITGLAVSSFGLILAPALLLKRKNWQVSKNGVFLSLLFGLLAALVLIITQLCLHNKKILTPENALFVLLFSIIGVIIGEIVNRCFQK